MKTLEKIQNRLENENNFAEILAGKAGVEDYYSQEYSDIANGNGWDFDLMYDCDDDNFSTVETGWGGTYEQGNNMLFIGRLENCECEEELENVVNYYIEQQSYNK